MVDYKLKKEYRGLRLKGCLEFKGSFAGFQLYDPSGKRYTVTKDSVLKLRSKGVDTHNTDVLYMRYPHLFLCSQLVDTPYGLMTMEEYTSGKLNEEIPISDDLVFLLSRGLYLHELEARNNRKSVEISEMLFILNGDGFPVCARVICRIQTILPEQYDRYLVVLDQWVRSGYVTMLDKGGTKYVAFQVSIMVLGKLLKDGFGAKYFFRNNIVEVFALNYRGESFKKINVATVIHDGSLVVEFAQTSAPLQVGGIERMIGEFVGGLQDCEYSRK